MNKRPHYKDTEEDILKQQQEFLFKNEKPAVKIIKDENILSKITNSPVENKKNEDTNIKLIGSIIERKSKIPENMNMLRFSTGFPQAKKRETSVVNKKCSIFSQHNKKLKVNSIDLNLPSQSYVLTGQETNEIHQNNIETLSQISESEILDEQQKLFQSLDPKLIEFLKSKRVTNKNEKTIEPQNKMEVDTTENDFSEIIDNELLENSEKWLHFSKIEPEKLEWMKTVEIPEKIVGNYEARFDFNGYLLPYTDDITEKNRALYHHGDEAYRPGYNLNELFKLCRSNVSQQRILALNIIANILSLNSTGIYDHIIDIPIEQIFFVIRICVDENIPSILNSSIKCLHNLYYYQIDEICLDTLTYFGDIYQPMLAIDARGGKETNDQQMAELDMVQILARTDIFIRIRYIINTIKPNSETIVYCLEILIRLARDSNKIFQQMINTEYLIENIIKYFVPKIYKLEDSTNNCYNKPVISAMKLLRILSCRCKNLAESLINKYNITDSLLSYTSLQIYYNIYGIKIQIESFKLLKIFFRHHLLINHFREIQPFLLLLIDYHYKNTDINNNSYTLQNHFSSILNIISEIVMIDFNLVQMFVPLLMQCCTKYFAQACNITNFKLGNLQIISSLLITMTNIIKFGPVQTDDYLNNLISDYLDSPGFHKITENISAGSNLLCELDVHKTGPNFITVGGAMWQATEHVVPTLNSKSCVPFLKSLSFFIENSNNKLIQQFLQHININKYLQQLKSVKKLNLTSNWFTRNESEFILNILKSSVKCQNLSNLFFFYELTVKCLSIFTIEHKFDIYYLLKNVIFNKNFIPNEILFNELNLQNDDLKNVVKYLDEINLCYAKVMNLNQPNNDLIILTIDTKIGNIIPNDWVFLPIIYLHSQFEENNLKNITEEEQIFLVTRCLQWIFFYENYFQNLSNCLSTTDKFCRMSCIFLCSNTLFLEKDVHYLLEINLKMLTKNLDQLNFDQDIQGLNNFQDFYIQLLEQYQGVSYGDKLFANFILIPLIQKFDSKWRKILWSEYFGVTQTIILQENECFIDIKQFLYPEENDLSILKCYRRALVSEQLSRSPFLKKIAEFHVENYVKNKKSST